MTPMPPPVMPPKARNPPGSRTANGCCLVPRNRPAQTMPTRWLAAGVRRFTRSFQAATSAGSARRCCRGGFLVKRVGLFHATLILQATGEIGEHDRIAGARDLKHLPVMIFTNARPLRLGHDHAHQVVCLQGARSDADGVAGMDFQPHPKRLLPSNRRASSLVASKLFGSNRTMRRISASAAAVLPSSLRIEYSSDNAPGRSGASSRTSRHNCSATSLAPCR